MAAKHVAAVVLMAMTAMVLAMLTATAAQAATMHTPRRYRVLIHAENRQSCWYNYGYAGPCSQGYDCSGLVYSLYRNIGINLPRTTYGMLASSAIKPTSDPDGGDLVFFGSGHVELYDGRHTTVGALEPGTKVGFHRWYPGSSWVPSGYYHVRNSG